MMKGVRGVCTAGKHVTIYYIMIKYMGRSVTYVQYMPVNPIKHDIKVFAIFCAISEILLGLKVYVGQEDDSYNTVRLICDDIVKEAALTSVRGRTLYTNNYYMSMALSNHMFNNYVWKISVTIVSTDKKSRADNDIPFLKFPNVSRNGLQLGWYHGSEINIKNQTGKAYFIQCTTWHERKQVLFLNLNEVGYT